MGLGGYDLWCSLWNGHRWTRPINLGNSINTPGDETNPVFYNNYLIFTSDSVPGGQPGNNLYALYLREATSIDEIIFGTYTIQSLPYPINSGSNDMNMAFHHSSSQGWWISSRSGKRELYSFVGQLAGVMLSGTASDTYNSPLPHANISIALDGRTAYTSYLTTTIRYRPLSTAISTLSSRCPLPVQTNNFSSTPSLTTFSLLRYHSIVQRCFSTSSTKVPTANYLPVEKPH